MYEVYIYLDPRTSGQFVYNEHKFDYKPVYVGKGKIKDNRRLKHLYKSSNIRLKHLIQFLRTINMQPIIVTIAAFATETEAIDCEKSLITLIGRADKKLGPLYNFTDGGEGMSGYKYSPEQIEVRRKRFAAYFKSLTPEQLKMHGQKSLSRRDPINCKLGTLQAIQTKRKKSKEVKQLIEEKRYEGWKEKYYSRTEEEKATTSLKCSIASKRKKQCYVTMKDVHSGETLTKFVTDWSTCGYSANIILSRIRQKSTLPVHSKTTGASMIVIDSIKISPASLASV